MSRLAINRHRSDHALSVELDAPLEDNKIALVHRSLPEYAPTPLVPLPRLAEKLGVGNIQVKDESYRFGLAAFKALGSTWAIYCDLLSRPELAGRLPDAVNFYKEVNLSPGLLIYATATDGNHGRGVAWTARKLGQKAVIFMPQGTVDARVENIRKEGAEVIVVDGDYDDAVAECRKRADQHGWQIISDMSWDSYTEIPQWIQAGYRTLFGEIAESHDGDIDVILIPGGVGALAACAGWFFSQPQYQKTKVVSVEPINAACLLESCLSPDGTASGITTPLDSIMAGLNCGTTSPVAWPFIRNRFDAFLAIEDHWALEAMRAYYHPTADDSRIISGESGAATLGGLLALRQDSSLVEHRSALNLDHNATVLLLNTEGATDPIHFSDVVRDSL